MRWLYVLTVLLVVLLGHVREAAACCPAPPPGVLVQIADQELVIVWDPVRKIEHMIRRANFATKASSFGFLVPTPGVPTLAQAPDELFERFSTAITPEIKWERSFRVGSVMQLLILNKKAFDGSPSGAAVRVVLATRVAGYDAVVLEASDAEALGRWLTQNGYESRPALIEWIKPYVDRRWKITAFKLAAGQTAAESPDQGSGSTRYAVRMSFATDQPLFPFRTPSDQHAQGGGPGGGLLRIHLVAPSRMDGKLADDRWPAEVRYARAHSDLGTLLGDAVPADHRPSTGWLTTFEDKGWPRPATGDLYFGPTKDPSPIVPAPWVRDDWVTIPVEPLVLFGAVVLVVLVRRARRRRDTSLYG